MCLTSSSPPLLSFSFQYGFLPALSYLKVFPSFFPPFPLTSSLPTISSSSLTHTHNPPPYHPLPPRYFLSLQIKEDLINMKLVCSEETYSILAGYVVQGEFGDYDPMEHTPGYLEDFPFLENRSPEVRSKVEELHQRNRLVGERVSWGAG